MRALLICVGSRGDAEPIVALADRLLEAGHAVELFLQPELKGLAPRHENLNLYELPFTQFDFYLYTTNPTKGKDLEGRPRFVAILADLIVGLVLPTWKSVWEAAQQCHIMVTTALARALVFALASKLDIPAVLVHLQALTPTKAYTHYSNTEDFVKAVMELDKSDVTCETGNQENIDSHWMLEKLQYDFLRPELDELYEDLDLSPKLTFATMQAILSGNNPQFAIANCYFDGLVPQVQDGGPNVHYVGSLADHYVPKGFAPPTELVSFLEQNPEPLCVGFGSMPYNQVNLILDALQEVDCQAILVGKALEVPSDHQWAKSNNVHQVDSIPYAWLLPHCRMMLCHGGAGVLHTTLRAGIPVVISPFFGDQFTHAALVQAKKLGARAGETLPQATKDDFVQAIGAATECIGNAKAFAERVQRQPLGVDNMVTLMDSLVSKDV